MRRPLQMHITLTSGLSTVSNIDITAPATPAQWSAPSHHTTTILRQYLQDRFTTTIETARHNSGTQQRPISANTVCRRLASNNIIVDVLLEGLSSQTVTNKNDYSGPHLVNIGTISNGEESSSHTKVGSVFRRRMAGYGFG